MEILFLVLFAGIVLYWILPAGVKAANAALNGEKLNEELRDGRVEVVKLFEQELPGAAEEKFKVLKQRAETFCAQKNILSHEVPTFLPGILELQETFYAAQEAFRRDAKRQQQVSVHTETKSFTETPLVKSSPEKQRKISSDLPARRKLEKQGGEVVRTPIVKIVPNTETGEFITPYKSKPNHGFINLKSEEVLAKDGFLHIIRRQTLKRGELTELLVFIEENAEGTTLPGKIITSEFFDNEIPAEFEKRFKNEWSLEQNLNYYTKRSGAGGIALTKGGKRIVRFTDYVLDPKEGESDLLIDHDNEEEVKRWKAEQDANAVPQSASSILTQKQVFSAELTINLDAVAVLEPLRVKSHNPYHQVFRSAPYMLRYHVVMYYATLSVKLNLVSDKDAMTWLKTLSYSLEVDDSMLTSSKLLSSFVEEVNEQMGVIHTRVYDVEPPKQRFNILDSLSEEQLVLFVYAFSILVQNTSYYTPEDIAQATFILPRRVAGAVVNIGSYTDFKRKVKDVMIGALMKF